MHAVRNSGGPDVQTAICTRGPAEVCPNATRDHERLHLVRRDVAVLPQRFTSLEGI